MWSWLRHARDAGRIVSDRAELWIAGALAWLAYGGALLFIGSVVPLPTAADLAFFTSQIVVAGSVLPALLLGLVLLAGFVFLLTLHAAGESLVAGELDGRRDWLSWLRAGARLLGIYLVAAVPVAAAGLLLSWRLAVVGPAEYQSPDIGGSLPIRIAGGVAPELALVLLALLAVQVVTAGASWRVAGRRGASIGRALRGGLSDAAHAPLRLTGVAIVSLAAHLVYAVLVVLLLRLLFAPIGAALAMGEVRDLAVAALLIGFVAIWLCLVLGGGALHAWSSTWWALEMKPSGALAAPQGRDTQQHDTPQHEGASP